MSIPAHWEWKKLRGVLAKIESGGRPKGGVSGITEGIPSLGGEHLLYNGRFNFEKIKYIPIEYYQKMKRGKIKRNDVLVVKDGATTGKTSFVGDDFPFKEAAINEHVFIMRTVDDVLPKTLFYWFQSSFGQQCVKDNFRGAAQGGITLGILDNSKFPVPPLPEQERIVSRIEELFTQLDAGVASLRRVQAALKRYRASVLKAACEGRLVPQDPNDVPAEELLRRIGKEPLERDDLPKLPGGWCWTTLPKLGHLGRGKSKHRPRNAAFLYGGIYPFIQTGDIRNANGVITTYNQTYSDSGLAQSKLWPKGTLCITIAANIAETTILGFDACFPDSVVGFIPKGDVDVKFIEFYFRTIKANLDRLAPATAQKNINLDVLQKVPIPLPPPKEQRRIVDEVERWLSVIVQVKSAVDAGLKRAERLRQAILNRAFEGKLVPQEPNDELTSQISYLIKAEQVNLATIDRSNRSKDKSDKILPEQLDLF
jgi:type I restriction enzyme S subunit